MKYEQDLMLPGGAVVLITRDRSADPWKIVNYETVDWDEVTQVAESGGREPCSCVHVCYKRLTELDPEVGLTPVEGIQCQRDA